MPDDDIHGGTSGDDTLTGGAGADVFVFEPETSPANSNDIITDFTDDEDVIDFSRFSGIAGFDDLNITSDGTDSHDGGRGCRHLRVRAGERNDTIKDFADGEDIIDLTAISGISGFEDLTITADGTTAVIDLTGHGGGTIRLDNVSVGDLDATDFVVHQADDSGTDGM